MQLTSRLLTFIQFSQEIRTVSTVNRRKNMPACSLRHTISNEMLESRFRVHVSVILNIQNGTRKSFRFFESRHLYKHVDLFMQNFTKFSSTFKIKEERIRQQCM